MPEQGEDEGEEVDSEGLELEGVEEEEPSGVQHVSQVATYETKKNDLDLKLNSVLKF